MYSGSSAIAEPRCNELIEFEWYWTDNFGTKVNKSEAD